MSYIDNVLKGGQSNTDIVDFLLSEGFEFGNGALDEGKMYYVAHGNYIVWITLCDDYLSLYAEYECGGEVDSAHRHFEEGNFDSFMDVYGEAVDWAKRYM